MGRIQSTIGLITGVNIADTVDALMELSAQPRNTLISRTESLQVEQAAVTELSAMLLKVKFATDNLGKSTLYGKRQIASSDSAKLAATVTGQPLKGSYQFAPLRMAQSQQWLTSGFKTTTEPIGAGSFSFRFGDNLQRGTSLSLFGGGEGVARGKIRITDRSGASAEVDLSTVQTVADVVEAINTNSTINVTASAHGDGFRLVDNTGLSVSNLKVQEVNGGTTAASLGLAGIDAAAATADGDDMIELYEGMSLDLLNDGAGVHFDRALDDIEYELRDGTTGTIDLSPIIPGGSEVDAESTLADVLAVINAADPTKLKAEIGPDGDRLVLTDLTTGGGTFSVGSLFESDALADLGLDGTAVGGTITGRRIMGSAGSVLVSSLGGGSGLGTLGSIDLTDRSGASASVDLSTAETLEEAIDAINAAGLGIVAQVNQAKNGIRLVDTTGASASNLIVANGDATNSADALGITVDAAVTSVNSGDLHLQVVSYNTLLSSYNGGSGVAGGSFTIIDTAEKQAVIDLSGDDVQTIGDVIREINLAGLDVQADINSTGDGIVLRNTGSGSGTLSVIEGSTTTAADLHLLGTAAEVDFEGVPTLTLDGTITHTITIDETQSLADLMDAINDLDTGVTAMALSDGSFVPNRLALGSNQTGKAGQLMIDTSQLAFSVQETVRAQDALMSFGPGDAANSVLLSSSTNTFNNVLSGASLEIKQTSTSPVTVTVSSSDTDLVATVQTFVDNYNTFRDRLDDLTAYDVETDKKAILTGDGAALRLENELSYMVSGAFYSAGSIRSLAEVGISVNSDGSLSFTASKLRAKYTADPAAVEEFFTTDDFGVSAKFDSLLEGLAESSNSLLSSRIQTLADQIDRNQERIEFLTERLEVQRERLLRDFYYMESAVGKMQNSLSFLDSIQPLSVQSSKK